MLGYIAVGRGQFRLARALCAESYALGDLSENANLAAWSRGLQSFCEYYAGDYRSALQFAESGLSLAGDGPQSVRLMINGVARAHGKLGDASAAHAAVESAYELLSRFDAPDGLPSSISLNCYGGAQVAGNALTAYISSGSPERAQGQADLVLPAMQAQGSPWGHSLVLLDLATAEILSINSDIAAAASIASEAIGYVDSSVVSVIQRTREFLALASESDSDGKYTQPIADALEVLELPS